MTSHASYILNGYSFIYSLPEEQILKIGNQAVDGSPIPSFDEELLINLCEDAKNIFEKEENVINIDGDVIVVGDIHGSLHDLLRILNYIETSKSKVIFLGDYVDRGNFSLECITLLFALKVLKPDTYFLLRGNHEFDAMCSQYGFKKEILNYHNPKKVNTVTNREEMPMTLDEINFDLEEEEDKEEEDNYISNEVLCDNYYANHVNMNCYKYSEKLYEAFIRTFSYLPIASIVNQSSICLHGGLTPLLDKVEAIKKQIQRPISDFDDNELLCDITWGDPAPNLSQFYGSSQRGRGRLFNGAAVVNFLKNNNLKRIIRGHECVKEGIMELFNEKCITVFSASSYGSDMGNSSAILRIYKNDDSIEPIEFPPIHRLKKYDAHYYKVQSFYQTQNHKSMFSVCNQKISEYKSGYFSSILKKNNVHSDQNHTSRQLVLNETKILGQSQPSSCFIPNQAIISRKAKIIASRGPSLRSGPRKKIFASNVCLIPKSPPIIAPKKILLYTSQIVYDKNRNPICEAGNNRNLIEDDYSNMDDLSKMQM